METLDRLCRSGALTEAERFLQNTLAEASGEARISLLNELGGFYRGLSRHKQSADAFREALQCLEDAGQIQGAEYDIVLLNLAGTCRLAGRLDEAEDLLQQALSRISPEDTAYGAALNGLSLVKREQGSLDDAARLGEAALKWLAGHDSPSCELATAQSNQASVCLEMGDLDRASRLVGQALRFFEALPEPDTHYAAALSVKGAICFRQGDWDEAERAYQSAMSLTEHFFGHNREYEAARAALEVVRRARRDGQ